MSLTHWCPEWPNCFDADRPVLFQGLIVGNAPSLLGGDVGETDQIFQTGPVQALLAFHFRTMTFDAMLASQAGVS